MLDEEKGNAIVKACDEIIAGKLHNQFIVDAIQGGAGTSANMNANEVIANRAIEILGGKKGDYSIVHPNDHVNMAQSTNDVIPCAGKLTILNLLPGFVAELERLHKALRDKSIEFDDVVKMGRTQLQDAVPIRLGQSFGAYAAVIERDIQRIKNLEEELKNTKYRCNGSGNRHQCESGVFVPHHPQHQPGLWYGLYPRRRIYLTLPRTWTDLYIPPPH